MSWDVADPFMIRVTVGPEDCDEFGHTNNVMYLQWLENAAWEHSRALGLGFADYERIGAGCVVRRHELEYLSATHPGDVLDVATWISGNDGRVDLWRDYQVRTVDEATTVLRARTRWICIDMETGRPRRQPKEFLDAYRPHDEPIGP